MGMEYENILKTTENIGVKEGEIFGSDSFTAICNDDELNFVTEFTCEWI